MACPSFRNLRSFGAHSALEIKENLRKNYQTKLRQRRNSFYNKDRENSHDNEDVKNTLKQVWHDMINDDYQKDLKNEDIFHVMHEVEEELLQEELNKVMEEYENAEKSLLDNSYTKEVICPVCQKANVGKSEYAICCDKCQYSIKTTKSLEEFKTDILFLIDKHSNTCTHHPQFIILPETDEKHLYLFCDFCSEMFVIM